jgi:GntR family transcriptional regulator/MocR family aminotransferase
VGTFSKVLFPSIRLAYLVAPDDLVEAFVTARMLTDGHTPQLMQAVVADFITEGHFGAHLRRMRGLYRERRDVLLETAGRELRDGLDLGPADAGLHVAGYLRPGRDDVAVSRRAEARGLAVPPLSRYHVGPGGRPGLLVGYGGLAPAAIRRGLRLLAGVLPR